MAQLSLRRVVALAIVALGLSPEPGTTRVMTWLTNNDGDHYYADDLINTDQYR